MSSTTESNAMPTAASQKGLWSENVSTGGAYGDRPPLGPPTARVYEDDQSGMNKTNSGETQEGPPVKAAGECSSGVERKEGSANCVSSSPSADSSPPPVGEKRPAATASDENEPPAVDGQERQTQDNYSGSRRLTTTNWERNDGVYGQDKLTSASTAVPVDSINQQREPDPSRGSTPLSSRNMSPSGISHRFYHDHSHSSSTSTPASAFGEIQQPPGFVPFPTTAQSTAPRHHPPFPFFANPFMVPFAPHLPQTGGASGQSPSNDNSTPEDWAANMTGVRRNPDSGGFYLHPQYYHELLQQYFRSMAVSDAATPTQASVNCSEESTTNTEAYSEPVESGNQSEAVDREESPAGHRRGVPAPSINSELTTKLNLEETRVRAMGQDGDSSRNGNENEDSNVTTKTDDLAIPKLDENEVGSEAEEETNSARVSRPETLHLDDNTLQDQSGSNIAGDDSENQAAALIRKQISEIEKQILRRAQNQNIRKMDAKEIEAFLLMEQQRTLEANLFESTNSGVWAPSAFPWLQNDAMHWERPDGVGPRQFEPAPDQRTLFELAAAAARANDSANAAPQMNQPGGYVHAYFPQASTAYAPQPPAVYPSSVPWPPSAFYPPGAAAAFGFPTGHPYFTPSTVYSGSFPQEYLTGARPFPVPTQQRQMAPDEMARLRQDLQMPRQDLDGTSGRRGDIEMMAGPAMARPNAANTIDSGQHSHQPDNDDDEAWKNEGRSSSENIDEDEPVWVLRESYVRKMKREEERQAQKELSAKQTHADSAERTVPDSETFEETDKLLDSQRNDSEINDQDTASPRNTAQQPKKNKKKKEVMVHEPAVLIEGVLFRARYLGSTQLVCDGRPTKATRMMQAQEAVSRIKAPDGEQQPSTDVDLFISTEKIMVLNTDLQRISETDVRQDIMMDHPLRTISYIADIGELVVLMARRVSQSSPDSPEPGIIRTPKIICHVFESEEAQFIAQSIGQAFQVAYMEFLRANGIDDPGYLRDVDYQEVLNAQEIFGEELEMFARKETQKDVVVPKQKNEIFGVVIVESGWGSMLPTVVIANLMPGGPAARSNNLNIGDHIIALNGISFVGLPLSACQNHIRNVKHLTAVKLTVVHTQPVVEVRIKRPDTKYQLGFSVQNGVICSLLRGGIAERGGVRVGHRIIEINSQSVVAVPHEKIVTMLATAVGEIQMKTMPTSMFRLLTGQETPNYI